jgi:multiple sugar transport system substrate-binding protein
MVVAFGVASLALTGCVGGSKASSDTSRNATVKSASLVISANAIAGGKNAAEADWLVHTVIPGFEKAEKAKGVDVKVTFRGSGVDDSAYLTKIELGLKTNTAPDIAAVDGIWLGSLQAAGYIKPLTEIVGDSVNKWDGWSQITDTVRGNMEVNGKTYGVPQGTDGRVIYFNKSLFQKAGLPTDWQPKSWDDILAAGRALKKVAGVTPIQLDAGVPMGEATTAQGFLPLLAGTSEPDLYDPSTKKWQGATQSVVDVLNLYKQIYRTGLGDPKLQQDQNGRDVSFAEFSKNKIGILVEGDYFWRSIVCPDKATCSSTAMPDRNSVVGFAFIPSKDSGKYVSISGGGGWIISPGTKYPQQAWDLMTYMNSASVTYAEAKDDVRITARNDVNKKLLGHDPLLSFIAQKVLPVTRYRPSDANYNDVSTAIQQATAAVVSGTDPQKAADDYQKALEKIVGAANVSSG